MVEILISFWDGLFSGAMLVSGRVDVKIFQLRLSFFRERSFCVRPRRYSPGLFATTAFIATLLFAGHLVI